VHDLLKRATPPRAGAWACVLHLAFVLPSAAQEPFRVALRPQLEVNNHIEFGISVDPSTVPQSRESSQLRGVVARTALEAESSRAWGRDTLRLRAVARAEDFSGEEGFLDRFDGWEVPVRVTWSRELASALPPFTVRADIRRLQRSSALYDVWEPALAVGLGEFLVYEHRQRRFDSQQPREDYLLVNARRHHVRSALKIRMTDSVRADIFYRYQHEEYGTNLSALLLIVLDEANGFRRQDDRHQARGALLLAPWGAFLAQASGDLRWNRSNTEFYRFRSGEASLVGFWRVGEGRWLRAEVARVRIEFSGRRFAGVFGGPTRARADDQWRLTIAGQAGVNEHLSLRADGDLLQNRTNDTRATFDFLNYTQRVARLSLTARF
jgi:hypothetical protein